ncbi:retrovirus-related pol polyprotein from transposon TNT 1-94 [Tanacetum coccineum]
MPVNAIDEQELEAHYSYMAKIQEVQNHDENDVFANVRRHSEQPESINDTYVLEKDDSDVIPDSSNICTNDNQVDQNAAECVDERAALANLTLDTEENKTVLKQLKKANASLTQELEKCKTNLDETSRALGEATSSRDSCLIALQTKQTELEKYTALNDLTSDYKILQTKLNDTLGLLAIKNIDIKEGLKTKTYEISVVNQKHDELVKKSLLNRSQFEGQLKEKTKVISDLKVKEGKDIDTMIEMEKQIKFLNEILYKRNQSIQTIHMLAPKCATYHGRSTFANPKYCKKAQSDKPCLYEIPYDTSDPANRFAPDGEDTVTLEKESRSKLDKDKLKKLILVTKGKSVETQFDKPSVVRQPNAQRIPKPSVLGKPTPFSNSPEMRSFQTNKSVNKTNASDGLFKPVTQQNLPQKRNQAVRNTNVLKPGMFRIASTTTQTRTPQLPHASRNTNPHMSKSSGVIHTTSVSRPQLKCYQVKDKVVPNNSQVKFQKKEVEDHHRISSISKKTKSVTACNDSSNSRTSNVNAVCAECGKCVFNSNHDACVSRYLKDVNARTKKPKVVPISASKPKRKANKSVATPHKKTVASDTTIQKSKSYYKELYENTNQEWKWWIAKRCPSGYKWTQKPLRTKKIWMPKIRKDDVSASISPTIDIISRITNGLKISNSLGSNLSNVPSSSNSLEDCTTHPIHTPTQAWLWHRRLSHLNFDYITLLSKKEVVNGLPKLKYVKDQLCSSCEMSKAKRSSFKTKAVPSSKGRLNLLHMDLCGPMRVASINGKKYILVIVDDYSRYTWTLFLRSKDETPEVLKDFLTMIQRNLQAQVITVRTDRGTKFLNKTLHAYFKEEGIDHQTSTPRTPEQNGVVERRNRTLVEAARTMLSASKLPLSFWAEAVATACYTQNRSIIISTHGKTAYHIINDRKPSIKHLHIFGCICYITRDGENLDKMKEKGDPCVMVGYSTQSKGYRVYNKRTRLIVESIHIKFDEIKEMMSDHNSSDLAPQRQEMSVENVSSGLVPQGQKASDYDNSDPVPPRQNVVPTAEKTDSSQQGLEFLFSPLLEEYYNPTHGLAEENNNDQAPNASFQEAEFINPFCTRVQEIGESSSRNIDNTDVHSFQPQSHDYRWTRDHPLEQVRGNPLQLPVQTRLQLEFNAGRTHQFEQANVGISVRQSMSARWLLSLSGYGKNNKELKCKISLDLVACRCYCARYQARPTQKHLKEVKRIFKYLKGTINMGLWYPKDSGFELTAFSDADHAGCLDTRKSTSGGIQFLGDKLVSWMSKKQNCTAMSSAEAEYVALSASCAQVMWMRTQLKVYGFNYNIILLYYDSQSAIAISCKAVQHSHTKHIHTRRIGMRCLTPAELEVLTNITA